MPAATTTAVAPPEPVQQQLWYRPVGDKVLEPFSTPLTEREHKIRNLEKRKLKLDQYRNEQAEGKTLIADQQAAVAKYDEVILTLDHNREMVACLRQVHQQTIKFIKNELRREINERNKFVLSLQAVVDLISNATVQRDLLLGENGAPTVSKEDLFDLTEMSKVLKPSLRDPEFGVKVEAGAELISKLFESRGKINNKPSQQVKTLIDVLAESQYFTSAPHTAVTIESVEEIVPIPLEVPSNQVHVPEATIVNTNPVSAQMMMDPATYSFIQESQLEIESPHMDPAVVAVSSFAPPPPQQLQQQPDTNHVYSNEAVADTMSALAGGVRELNLNHNLNSQANGDEEEEWDDKLQSGNYNNTTNGNMKDEEGNGDEFSRGSFRGRGGRGRGGRGYNNGYGNPRPPKSNRGFNPRGGYGGNFRAERTGQPEGGDSMEYRGKGGRGHSRPYRGNGNGNAPTAGGASRRGIRGGPPKSYNGNHENARAE